MLQQKPHMELRKYDLYFVSFDQEIRLLSVVIFLIIIIVSRFELKTHFDRCLF